MKSVHVLTGLVTVGLLSMGLAAAQTFAPVEITHDAPEELTCDELMVDEFVGNNHVRITFAPVPGASMYEVDYTTMDTTSKKKERKNEFVSSPESILNIKDLDQLILRVRAIPAHTRDEAMQSVQGPAGKWSEPCAVPIGHSGKKPQ